ncbi:MAG: isocitrate lyase/PEP mutase family protein [Candidatus Tectomicrobia bacterium]|nr:isocitrate lyase/PEP mutase family protein [Candidatus Tectomicrobia bacterium]
MTKGERLRHILTEGGNVIAPGIYDAVSARIAEAAGFEMMLLPGSNTAATLLGVPDIGLVTLTELSTHVKNIARATTIPMVIDADVGFGNAMNTARTVEELEGAGAAAIILEDGIVPQPFGKGSGESLVSQEEMCGKIGAAVAVRQDSSTVIIARTNSRSVEGVEGALKRAESYANSGADAIFVIGLKSREEYQQVRKALDLPLVASFTDGASPSLPDAKELEAIGYRLILYPRLVLQTAAWAMEGALAFLAKEGHARPYIEKKLDPAKMNSILRGEEFKALEKRFLS